jgi:hypothetical protein
MAVQAPAREFQPPFSSRDCDIVLRSSDDTYFRVHSLVLRPTCTFFYQLLSLPQDKSASTDDVISLDEDSVVVERLLRMVHGLEVPRWVSYEELESVLFAADKYGATGPITAIRSAITAPHFLEQPLRLYGIAARFDWLEELQLASKLTLTLSIHDPKHAPTLEKIPPKYLLKLFELHHERQKKFCHELDTHPDLVFGNTAEGFCGSCKKSARNNYPWRDLKRAMCMELSRRPLGDTLLGFEMMNWPETKAFRNVRCSACETAWYSEVSTFASVRACLERLPQTI